MEKFKNINQLSNYYENTVKDCIKQTYAYWLKNHYTKIWHLQSILDELKVYLPADGKTNNLPEELWDEVKKKFNQIISWADKIKYTAEDLSLRSLTNIWQKGFSEIQYNLPEKIKLDIQPSLFQINPNDKNGIKFRKKLYTVLKVLSLNIYGSNQNSRKINLHNFLIHYLEVPVSNLILKFWQQYLHEISDQYYDIFKKLSELKDKVLLFDDLENLQDPFEKNDYFEKIFKIAEILNQTDIILQSLQERENQLEPFIEKEWKNISEYIEYSWQYAGTFILPNKKFRDEVLSYNKKIAEKDFKKYHQHWKTRFDAIKVDWIKNLEIFLLQLHVMREFRNSSKNIIINHEVILNPAFESILSTIEKEEKKYYSNSNSAAIKQKVINTRDRFLSDFKNQKMPQLVDAINQTQIPENLENYIYHIESSKDKISAIHNIIKFHKNGSILPKPKIYTIALPHLIDNEVLLPHKKYYSNQIDDAKNRINSIIRSLAEISHIYDLNWESAYTLLENNNGNGEFEEALSIIKTSFTRSKEIIKKLWQESKESLEFSKEILIHKSQELYAGYQRLTNTDQLIDYNSKLKREKSQIHLRHVIKKLFDLIQQFLLDQVKNWFKNLIFKNQIKQQFKRKSLENLEDNISNISKNAKLKLSNIPTVYKRLFLPEPLIESKFYYERKTETDKIVNAYKSWKNRTDILTILIGEKGCGKSSILNYSEKNLFTERKVFRINIESTSIDEKQIFLIFKKVLKFKNISTWESLEKKIHKNFGESVIILDNVHHLFLKSPDGFEFLERFLLFINNTKKDVFWLMSCSYLGWNYLERVLNISLHINTPIFVENLSEDQIKDIILERHNYSGFDLKYEAGDNERQSKKYKKLEHENRLHSYLQDTFFHKLHQMSNGNLHTSFSIWLISILQFNNDTIRISLPPTIKSSTFNKLNHDDLQSLLPFLIHDKLDDQQIAKILLKLKHQNSLSLNRMVSYGLIEKEENEYTLNMLYYPIIKEILTSKKFLSDTEFNHNGKELKQKNHLVEIDLYLPVKTDTLLARKIALNTTAVSKYADVNEEITVNFNNKIYDGVSMLHLKIIAGILDALKKDLFISEVTEMIFKELLKQKIINQEDFYNSE